MQRRRLASVVLLVSSTYVPLFLSNLLFYPDILADSPVQRFLLALVPFWWAYFLARWYVRMAERSFPLYHPLGCLAQCSVWVFHWVVVMYHAFFIAMYSMNAFLTTIFCMGIIVVEEGLFHSLLVMASSDPANLGTYEKARKMYAKGLIACAKLWYMDDADAGAHRQLDEERVRRPMRSMTL